MIDPSASTAGGGRPEPRCLLDRSRPCGGCVAESPAVCPYGWLLRDDPREPAGRN